LSITPITWDTMGLDSNDVNAGPNEFLVGARVTNTGAAAVADVVTTFNLGVYGGATPNNTAPIITSGTGAGLPTIHLTTGTANTVSIAALAAGASHDVYFDVTVERNSQSYLTAQSYYIAATDTQGD